MPTYAKLPKVILDYAVGYQSINTAQDNLVAMYDAISAYHGKGVRGRGNGPMPANLFDLFGHHNTIAIARASIQVNLVQVGGTIACDVYTESLAVRDVVRLGVGSFRIDVPELAFFGATAVPYGLTGANTRFCSPKWYVQTGTRFAQSAVFLELYEESSGDFVLTDFDFCATIFGRL